jgi:hypothetical protein
MYGIHIFLLIFAINKNLVMVCNTNIIINKRGWEKIQKNNKHVILNIVVKNMSEIV